MAENVLDAQGIRHLASVLAARSTEALQGIAGDVVAPCDRYALDRVCHAADGDPQGPRGSLLATDGEARGRAHALRKLRKTQFHGGSIERPPTVGTENFRKMLRVNAPEQHIRVGDGQ